MGNLFTGKFNDKPNEDFYIDEYDRYTDKYPNGESDFSI